MTPVRVDYRQYPSPPLRHDHATSSNSGNQGPGSSDEKTSAKMGAFRKLKPTCVSLMAIASQPSTRTSQHASLVHELARITSTLSLASFTPSIINYLLFPITQILRSSDPSNLPDNFLEAVFRLLSHVVTAWKQCEGGMDLQAWEQLWKFTAAAIGPKTTLGDKGKGRQPDQEVQLEAVRFLTALLSPAASGKRNHPTSAMMALCSIPKSPLMPTLFQTITLLLATSAPDPPHLQLQLSSLRLLRSTMTTFLSGKHQILASILPGLVSTVAKLIHHEAKALKGEVAQEAAGSIQDIIVATLNDADLRSLGVLRSVLDDLGQLAEEWEKGEESLPPEEPPPPSPVPSTASAIPADPFPPLTASYLAFTSNQLRASIPPILLTLSSHTSHLARQASADLAYGVIASCHGSLPLLVPHCLTTLLLLSRDEFDSVREDVRSKLRLLLSQSTDNSLGASLVSLLSDSVNALPRLIVSQQDRRIEEVARLITAIAETTTGRPRNPIAELLGANGKVERWSWALLDCLEFGRPTGWNSTANTGAKAAERGWQHQLGAAPLPMLLENSNTACDPTFPQLPLRYVESLAMTGKLGDMLVSLGSSGGETALHSVEHFMLFAKANKPRHTSKAVSALWVAQKLLEGIAAAQISGDEGEIGRSTRKMAKEVVRIVVSMDDDEEEDDGEEHASQNDPSDVIIPVERTTGISSLTTLLDRKPLADSAAAAETRRLHNQAQRNLLTALSLSTLALTSRILSTSFRPLLLTSLYLVLSHLTSPQAIIAQFAEIALIQVAYHTGYASTQNLILDNVDYVINVVSQRLTYARLSSTAPLVLIAMIRLVGEPIVPLVHDVVDEIFDALDDYHGYETLASSLLAVLVTLMEAMAMEVDATQPSEDSMRKKAEFNRIDSPPDPEKDFARFKEWYIEREKNRKQEVDEILQRAPQHAWGKAELPQTEEDGEQPEERLEEDEKPPTRTQEICTQILEKSIYFLPHRSPFLRARILSLIARATPVLASGNREGDLLPIIDRAWPLILNRLDDPEPYVVTEAGEVIASLCENVGDFMAKRVLDHAWPRFKRLLNVQSELDKKSALARRGGVGMQSSYTVSHRLHVAILKTATFVAREVPVEEDVLWQVMVTFRPFLDRRAHEELQALAMELYRGLGRRDGDALWVVLHATLGTLEGDKGVWAHLRDQMLDIEVNAKLLLADL